MGMRRRSNLAPPVLPNKDRKTMDDLLQGVGFVLVIIGLCVPYVLFSGEPDLVDTFIEGMRTCQ